MRPDLEIIQQWIEPGSRVLDLGCGDGSLLTYLNAAKKVSSVGLEIDAGNIEKCIASGVNVIEQNMDQGLAIFSQIALTLCSSPKLCRRSATTRSAR